MPKINQKYKKLNAVDALNEQLKKCEPCRQNSFIIEFEELPDEQKQKFSHYNKDEQFILYCTECKRYKLIPE